MSRIWWDTRPPHLKEVVDWWDWHAPNWGRFVPGRCRECHQRRSHKMSCSRRNRQSLFRETPWYLIAGFGVVLIVLDAALVYILWSTGLPNHVNFFGLFLIFLIVNTAFNLLWFRVFVDWLKGRNNAP